MSAESASFRSVISVLLLMILLRLNATFHAIPSRAVTVPQAGTALGSLRVTESRPVTARL
jgi:hypothetical protein